MNTTVRAIDDYDALKAGHTYDVCAKLGTRLVAFTDQSGQQLVSLYAWQVKDGLLRGKLVYVDDTQSPAMKGKAADQLCHKLPSGYTY